MSYITQSRKPGLYLAAPLFSAAEKTFNTELKQALLPFFEVYLPQEDGGLLIDMIKNGMNPQVAAERVFKTDIDALEWCDVLLVILDGRTINEGAAFELGYAYAKGKACFGLKTDPRQLLSVGNNPMVDSPLQVVFSSIESLVKWAEHYAVDYYHDSDGESLRWPQQIEPLRIDTSRYVEVDQ